MWYNSNRNQKDRAEHSEHRYAGRWWTWFSDLFAVGLVAIVASGLLLLKGPKGLRGRGGVELAAGIAVPLLFLIFF